MRGQREGDSQPAFCRIVVLKASHRMRVRFI
jgi:hypothetical protein